MWSHELAEHQDRSWWRPYCKWQNCYDSSREKLEELGKNMKSAAEQEGVVNSYIINEQVGRRVQLVGTTYLGIT